MRLHVCVIEDGNEVAVIGIVAELGERTAEKVRPGSNPGMLTIELVQIPSLSFPGQVPCRLWSGEGTCLFVPVVMAKG